MTSSDPQASAASEQRKGVFLGLFAYLWWGALMPFYLKWVSHVSVVEVLVHRIVWSMVLLVAIMTVTRRWSRLRGRLNARTWGMLGLSTLCVSANWFGFIWAIAHGHLLEAGLGYFINPLVSVLLGFLFLRERLRPLQIAALALAAAGVVVMTYNFGRVPALALWVAFTFGFYGLIRKVVPVDSIEGLTLETLLLGPLASAYLAWKMLRGEASFLAAGLPTTGLLLLAGVITTVPLLAFAASARRVRLATIGFMQFLTPSLQVLIAIAAFGEAFTTTHMVTFGLIWAGLFLYSYDSVMLMRGRGAARAVAVAEIPQPGQSD